MKNLATILAFVFAFTFTTQAQKKNKQQQPKLSVEQHVDLAIKKMTLSLDLSEKQQNQIKPILTAQVTAKKEAMAKRKEAKENKKKPTADEMYAMKSKQLDNQIMIKNKMKDILNKDQFDKFEKMQKRRKLMAMKKMKERKGDMKKRKMQEKQRDTEDGK